MGASAAIKQESSLEDLLSRKSLFFDNARAQYFVSADSKRTGINIDCNWNQPLMQNIRIVNSDKIFRPTETQILIYKNISKDSNSPYGILTFYEPINIGDPICDGPENLCAELLADKETFEGICDILFKYKQQIGIKVEVKNIKEDIWDVTKEKRLEVTNFSVFTKKANEQDADSISKAENSCEDNQGHHLTEFSQQTFEKLVKQTVLKYIKKMF